MRLKVLENLFKEIVSKGPDNQDTVKEKLVKKDVITLMECDPDEITGVKELLTKTGKKYKHRCIVNHKQIGMIVVNHSFEETINLLKPRERVIIKGFKTYKNK